MCTVEFTQRHSIYLGRLTISIVRIWHTMLTSSGPADVTRDSVHGQPDIVFFQVLGIAVCSGRVCKAGDLGHLVL